MPSQKLGVDEPSTTGVSRRATVLVVDDDPSMRETVVRILTKKNYVVAQASSATEARSLWAQECPEVTLVDLDLGGESSSVLLDEVFTRHLDTAVIILTGSDDLALADMAFARGAYGYVVKPFTPNELLMQINNAMKRRGLERSVRDHVLELERKVIESATGVGGLRGRLEAVTSDSSFADEQIVERLSSAVCLRDDDTGRHIERVSRTAAALADWRGFVVDPTPAIRLAAAMHDVGKIGIPDWVLLKPGRLTPDERTIIERHCELGYALLSGSTSPVLKLAASVALNHHERWDGHGYPNRRQGDDIPLEARITSVADVFDALTRDRVYRAALPLDTAIEIMLRDRGGLFDPQLLDLFLDHVDEVLAITKDLPDPPTTRTTRIVVAGDEPMLVDGLLRLMNRRGEMRVIGSGHTVAEALEAVRTLRPDVLLSDYRMPDGEAAGLTERVLADYPETKVVVLIDVATPEGASRCISAGCSAVIAKTAPVDEVARVIRRVHDGEVVIPAALIPEVVSRLRGARRSLGEDMTPREHQLLIYLAGGCSMPDIAAAMSISTNTARNYMQRVLEKLGAHSKLEAVIIAMPEGVTMTSGPASLPNRRSQ
jgi:putative two-component system response regulator